MIYKGILTFQYDLVSNKFVAWFVVFYSILFITADCCMLIFALVRVRMMVRKISGVSLNVTFMMLHLALLVMLIGL